MMDLLGLFVSNAYAETTGTAAGAAGQQPGGYSFFVMLAVFFVFMYFAIWRPQSKRAKEQQNLLSSLAKGDEVMTMGGVMGRVSRINEQYISLTIANNVDVVVQKSSVVNVLPKGTLKSIES